MFNSNGSNLIKYKNYISGLNRVHFMHNNWIIMHTLWHDYMHACMHAGCPRKPKLQLMICFFFFALPLLYGPIVCIQAFDLKSQIWCTSFIQLFKTKKLRYHMLNLVRKNLQQIMYLLLRCFFSPSSCYASCKKHVY